MTKLTKNNLEKVEAERDFYKELSSKYAELIKILLNHAEKSNH